MKHILTAFAATAALAVGNLSPATAPAAPHAASLFQFD